MAAVYGDYTRDRVGMFFGLTGVQLGILVAAGIPALWALQTQRWGLFAGAALGWAIMLLLVVVPVRGRSATGWLTALLWSVAPGASSSVSPSSWSPGRS